MNIIDLPSDGNLGPAIAKLSKGCVEEPILVPKWESFFLGICLLGLVGHVGICDFWDIRQVEHDGEEEHKHSDGQVDPLHIFQGSHVVKCEEYVRS